MCVQLAFRGRLEAAAVHPGWKLTNFLLVVVAIFDTVNLLGHDREDQAVSGNAAVGERDTDPRVLQLASKNASAASVKATVTVLQSASFLAFSAAGACRSASSLWCLAPVARCLLQIEVAGTVATVIGFARVQWTRQIAAGTQIGHDNLVLVQLRSGNWRRLCYPALRVAVTGALWSLDCTETERCTLWQAATWLASNANFAADGASLQNKWRLRLLVDQRQSFAFAICVQVARQGQARLYSVQAVALSSVLVFLRFEKRVGSIFQNEAKLVGLAETVVIELTETRRRHSVLRIRRIFKFVYLHLPVDEKKSVHFTCTDFSPTTSGAKSLFWVFRLCVYTNFCEF